MSTTNGKGKTLERVLTAEDIKLKNEQLKKELLELSVENDKTLGLGTPVNSPVPGTASPADNEEKHSANVLERVSNKKETSTNTPSQLSKMPNTFSNHSSKTTANHNIYTTNSNELTQVLSNDPKNIEIESEKNFLLGKNIDWLVREKTHITSQNELLNNPKPLNAESHTYLRPKPNTASNLALRRTRSYTVSTPVSSSSAEFHRSNSAATTASIPAKKKSGGGFFKRLFGHKDKEEEKKKEKQREISNQGNANTQHKHLHHNHIGIQPSNKQEMEIQLQPLQDEEKLNGQRARKAKSTDDSQAQRRLRRSRTTGSIDYNEGSLDDRLNEFLAFYAKKDASSNDNEYGKTSLQQGPNSGENKAGATASATASATATATSAPTSQSKKTVKVDALGRPLPGHPKKSKFKPILKNPNDVLYEANKTSKMYQDSHSKNCVSEFNSTNPLNLVYSKSNERHAHRHGSHEKPAKPTTQSSSGGSKFGSFLKRVTSNIDSESEYDFDGMNDYYDNEYHSCDDARETQKQNSDESDSDHYSDMESVSMEHDSSKTSNEEEYDEDLNEVVPPGLEEVKPLKKVVFSKNTFFNDPPQQICSRNPRKGEVEIKPNGTVIIHRLTAEQKREISMQHSQGIVVGGSGQLRLMEPVQDNSSDKDLSSKGGKTLSVNVPETNGEKDPYQTSTDPSTREIELITAEVQAETRAKNSSPSALRKMNSKTQDDDIGIETAAQHVTIDKPMICRRSGGSIAMMDNDNNSSESSLPSLNNARMDRTEGHYIHSHTHAAEKNGTNTLQNGSQAQKNTNAKDTIFPPPTVSIPNDVLYTRCCHLREILPVPSILKQIPKGKTDLIPILQLRNPKPSMVEVQSFSDYVSIAPIMCLSLDGVSLTSEMFRIMLSSILQNNVINKISLKNTPLDAEGWKFLCYFLTKLPEGNNMISLDLTMVAGIHCNVQRPSKSSYSCTLSRMQCNLDDRLDRNWNLLIASIGCNPHLNLHNFFVSGCKVNHLGATTWKNFLNISCKNVERLGLAYCALELDHIEELAEWISNNSSAKIEQQHTENHEMHKKQQAEQKEKGKELPGKDGEITEKPQVKSRRLTGLDLGFNNLKGKLQPFIKIMTSLELIYLSLNSTALSLDDELVTFFNVLALCRNLKFLDLSNNPQMFPSCTSLLTASLPLYPTLLRLHLDYNNMNASSVVAFAEMIPICRNMNYLSLLGNNLDQVCCRSLALAVKKSKTLISLDYDNKVANDFDWFPKKISIYTLQNMEHEIQRLKEINSASPDDPASKTLSSESPKTDSISEIQKEMGILLTKDLSTAVFVQRSHALIDRINNSRVKLHNMIDSLFKYRLKDQLSIEGKETLVRLCYIDGSLEKGLKLLSIRLNDPKLNINEPLKNTNFSDLKSQMKFFTGDTKHGNFGVPTALGAGPEPSPSTTSLSSLLTDSRGNSQNSYDSSSPKHASSSHHELASDNDIVQFEGSSASLNSKQASVIAQDWNREEGNVLKKTAKIMNTSTGVPKKKLLRASENMSSNEIKDYILNNDVGKVVDLIDQLEKGGVDLENIFKKTAAPESSASSTTNTNEEAAEKDEDSPIYFGSKSSLERVKNDEFRSSSILSQDSYQQSVPSYDAEEYDQEDNNLTRDSGNVDNVLSYEHNDSDINKTYDHLLNTIEQSRSNTNSNLEL
ncbi:hypothetical protein ACO0QE_000419 [Hanseniaspora vineae]